MAEIAPTPWRFDRDWDRIPTIFDNQHRHIAHIDKGNPQREANAKLIEAAPKLLEALELLQGFDFRLDDSEHGKEIRKRAEAAIDAANSRT